MYLVRFLSGNAPFVPFKVDLERMLVGQLINEYLFFWINFYFNLDLIEIKAIVLKFYFCYHNRMLCPSGLYLSCSVLHCWKVKYFTLIISYARKVYFIQMFTSAISLLQTGFYWKFYVYRDMNITPFIFIDPTWSQWNLTSRSNKLDCFNSILESFP